MKKTVWCGMVMTLALAGCMSTNTRNRVFTDDWADHARKQGIVDRRDPAPETKERPMQLGPATVTRDEYGRSRMTLGGDGGFGVDFERRGGRIRYRHKWDFVRPQRNR